MKIIRAQYLGMCFGVRDAITLAQNSAAEGPLSILGELVHNKHVLDDLRRRGAEIAHAPERAMTTRAMITAHGASEAARTRARALGLQLIDATCPLVHSAHAALARLVAAGLHPVIVGQREHVEVRGMTEDLREFEVVLSPEDVARIQPRSGFGVVAQTTQPIARVEAILRALRECFPAAKVEFADTVCRPTKQRQQAALDLAQQCTVVLVIGGANSNNTRELVATCSQYCERVHHIQSAADICEHWFEPDDMIGLTAGTSTPDLLIDAAENRLRQIAARIAELEPALCP